MKSDRVKDLITDLGWEMSNLSEEGRKTLIQLYKIFDIGHFDYTKNLRRVMHEHRDNNNTKR